MWNLAYSRAFAKVFNDYRESSGRHQVDHITETLKLDPASLSGDVRFVVVPSVHEKLTTLEWHSRGVRATAANLAKAKPKPAAGKMLHKAAESEFSQRHALIQHASCPAVAKVVLKVGNYRTFFGLLPNLRHW